MYKTAVYVLVNAVFTPHTTPRGNLYKAASLSIPPSRVGHRIAINLKLCPWCTSSDKIFTFGPMTRLAAEKLRVELYKTVKISRHS